MNLLRITREMKCKDADSGKKKCGGLIGDALLHHQHTKKVRRVSRNNLFFSAEISLSHD